ncbi:MAG: hypothetical protein QM762_24420 [Chryseolinea sp.]
MKTSILPFLVVNNGASAVEFYVNAFRADVLEKFEASGGKVVAHMSIEGAGFWMGDEEAEFDNLSPMSIGGSPVRIVIITSKPEELFERALSAGATQICPVTVEEFWKIGKLKDPFGHVWEIGHPRDSLT